MAVLVMTLAGFAAQAKDQTPTFFLHDGDRVVFYGDSITEQQMYGRDIEAYVATRFPKMRVSFLNSGWSGDRVTGGGGGPIETRLKRDVLLYKPTVVTIFLGMNDGQYTTDNPQNYQIYTTGLTHIVDELTQQLPGVRLTLLTPSFFDYAAKDRQPPPPGQGYDYSHPPLDYNQTLIHYGDFVKQLGAQRHIPVADLNAPMLAAVTEGRKTEPKFALSADGVHPNEVGHLIMASAVLKAWNAPSTVADITLKPGKVVTVTNPLPWPLPDAAKQAFSCSPLTASLDIFQIHWAGPMTGNASGSYALMVDGQQIATATAAQWASGFDLTQYPNLPENQQAQQVLALMSDHIAKWHEFFKGRSSGIAHANDVPTDTEIAALKAEDATLDDLRTQEYQAAQPKPHTFELQPAPVTSSSSRTQFSIGQTF